MPRLLMIAPAPVLDLGARLRLDVKFVEGMRLHARQWDGPVACVLWRGTAAIPFGAEYDPRDLGFELLLLDPGAPVPEAFLAGWDVVCASADSTETLALARRERRPRLVYAIEYTFKTRIKILRLDRHLSPARRLRSVVWHIREERRRREAFRRADGVQANGYPAFAAYRGLNGNTMLYLDNRMHRALFATPEEMAARAAALASRAPLRIVHSGRLEPMKGSADLIPLARALIATGLDFTLDIFGTGSLEAEIRAGAAHPDLQGRVRLHAPVDFERELVPWLRTRADVFLSCHRQDDPSCSYLESLGCGLPILGYRNEMWGVLAAESGGGWTVPLGDVKALARCLGGLARPEIAAAGERALAFARKHDFDREFRARMDHLAAIAA